MGDFFNFQLIFTYLPKLLSRLHVTLLIVVLATVIGTLLGAGLAFIRLYRIPVLNQLTVLYISFIRGTPILVQMFIVYYGLPTLLIVFGIDINRWDKLIFIILTYGLNATAFLSEIFRASIASVPLGQSEAAYSVGMSKLQTFGRIIAPQAFRIALPSFGTNLVGLLQDSSLAFTLGVVDIMGQVQSIGARTYRSFEGYVAAGIIFLALSILVEKGSTVIEKRLVIKHI
ncbi:MAG: amino acid ABC transporter permease [Clostridia bacterium]|nr:amino acid ABC transporter permease [Clostridia bacterium]